MADRPRIRVAQIATGNIGSRALRRVLEHPDLDLVGVQVFSPDKIGVDAGTLAGTGPVGIAATDSLDDIIAARPDCVLHMPHVMVVEDVERLLAAGVNVVSTKHDFHNPAYLDPVVRERVEAACRAGHASVHSTGSSPGFSTEALPLTLAALTRRIDSLEIHEFGDVSMRPSPEMILGGMGFGQVPAGPNLARQAHLRRSFGPSLALTAASLGFPVDELDVQGALAVATHDVEIAAGLVPAGTVGAQLNRVRGLRDRVPVISFTATWYVTQDVEPLDDTEWTFRSSGWRVLVHGDTPLDVTIGYPVDPSEYADFSPNLTAHRPVNCIPAVCAAAPGIVTTAELPLIVPRLGAAAN